MRAWLMAQLLLGVLCVCILKRSEWLSALLLLCSANAVIGVKLFLRSLQQAKAYTVHVSQVNTQLYTIVAKNKKTAVREARRLYRKDKECRPVFSCNSIEEEGR